jgi:hypothetical protein
VADLMFHVERICLTRGCHRNSLTSRLSGFVLSLFRMKINYKKTNLFLYKVLYNQIKGVILLHTNTGTGNRTDYDYGFTTI